MKTIGYFEGTDPMLLTELVARGFGTLPLANDWDEHGKRASHLEPGDVDLIIGYLHKLLPPSSRSGGPKKHPMTTAADPYRGRRAFDLLYPAKAYEIPVLVVVPARFHTSAKQALGEAAEFVTLVEPEKLDEMVRSILKY